MENSEEKLFKFILKYFVYNLDKKPSVFFQFYRLLVTFISLLTNFSYIKSLFRIYNSEVYIKTKTQIVINRAELLFEVCFDSFFFIYQYVKRNNYNFNQSVIYVEKTAGSLMKNKIKFYNEQKSTKLFLLIFVSSYIFQSIYSCSRVLLKQNFIHTFKFGFFLYSVFKYFCITFYVINICDKFRRILKKINKFMQYQSLNQAKSVVDFDKFELFVNQITEAYQNFCNYFQMELFIILCKLI